MEIKMTGIEYTMNELGETSQVNVKYSKYENSSAFNATVAIMPTDVPEKQSIDDLSKKDFDKLARVIMIDWINVGK